MIFKNWINRTFGSTGALTGSDIPYNGVNSLSEQLDDIEVDKASQAEVNAGTDDAKFVTAKTLADKPAVSTTPIKGFLYVEVAGGVITSQTGANLTATRVSNGRYTIAINNSVISTDKYAVVGMGHEIATSSIRVMQEESVDTRTSTSFMIKLMNGNGTASEPDGFTVTVME